MKYIQSSYEVCEHLLLLEYGGVTVTLKHSGNVGRNNNCEVLVNEASVSREHALITRLNNQYFLQDVGSKYGTFVETGLDCTRPLQEGDFLAFNDSYLEILTFRVYSQNGKGCFDLKAKLYKQDNAIGATFHSQQSLFIGRANKDITFNFP